MNEKPERRDLVVHYYWATWCGPCAISAQQLKGLKSRFADKLIVNAYSEEPEEVIEDYLNKNFKDQFILFSFAKIETKQKAKKSELIHWVSSYPYVFVTQNQRLIWQGNPTYPRRDFENFLQALEKGDGLIENLQGQNQTSEQDQKRMHVLREKKNEQLRNILDIEKKLGLIARKIFKETKNYIFFRNFISADVKVLQIYEQLLSHKEFESFKSNFLKTREADFRNALNLFSYSREELFFIARDLIFAEQSLKNIDLAGEIIERAMSLPEATTTYQDYNLWVIGQWHLERGELLKAKEYNDRAIEICGSQVHCPEFIGFYTESKIAIAEKQTRFCDGFWHCLGSAIDRLFH